MPNRPEALHKTTQQLVDACRAGDEEAWCELVAKHERLVFSIARCEGLSAEEAADVTQSVFVALLRQLDRLREVDRIDAWLAVVARRTSWRFRNSRRLEVLTTSESNHDIAPDEIAVVATRLDVHRAVEQLDDPCRTLIRALFLEQPTPDYATVATRIDRPVGSIGPLRARCLAALRNTFDQQSGASQ